MALILVVDDDPVFRELLSAAVREMGHEVLSAADGAAGLDSARAYPPHVIITDIIMPGMDGVEFNSHLQMDPSTKGIPILMLTGSLDKHMEVSTQFAPAMPFEFIVGKTAPLAQITEILKGILAKYYQI